MMAGPAFADSGILPDPAITPGAVRTGDVGEMCSTSTRELRHWSRDRDDQIMAEYGLPRGAHPQYKVDHLIPLCLGGADDDRNLCQSRAGRSSRSGMPSETMNWGPGCARWGAPASWTWPRRRRRSRRTGPRRS